MFVHGVLNLPTLPEVFLPPLRGPERKRYLLNLRLFPDAFAPGPRLPAPARARAAETERPGARGLSGALAARVWLHRRQSDTEFPRKTRRHPAPVRGFHSQSPAYRWRGLRRGAPS